MSDTVINRPIKIKAHNTVKGKGLTIERIYTNEGIHPYDEVKWERRDVVQANWKTGETVFEQLGVEYPDFWSVNASTIVTTKYFRGAVGAENREWSLKQVIDRVVLTYTKAGKEFGYLTCTDFCDGASLFSFSWEVALWEIALEGTARSNAISPSKSSREAKLRYTEA